MSLWCHFSLVVCVVCVCWVWLTRMTLWVVWGIAVMVVHRHRLTTVPTSASRPMLRSHSSTSASCLTYVPMTTWYDSVYLSAFFCVFRSTQPSTLCGTVKWVVYGRWGPGLSTILVKSIGNTNTNTFTGNTFPTHQQSQVRLRGGPAGCASFFRRRCGSQLQQCVKVLHATHFPPQVNKIPPPYMRLYRTKTAKWSHFFARHACYKTKLSCCPSKKCYP